MRGMRKRGRTSGVGECLQSVGGNANVVVSGDSNARFVDDCIDGVIGKFGVPVRNESGESLLDMCMECELTVGNTML